MYRIGIDLDNTIIDYDFAFCSAGHAMGYLPIFFNKSKQFVRNYLQSFSGGDEKWQRLQGEVYGFRMKDAKLMGGVSNFLKKVGTRKDTEIFIVSHKTQYGHFHANQRNLRQNALKWLENKNFFNNKGFSLSKDQLYFENSLNDKVKRIEKLNCTHFIDDLEDVFKHPSFPPITYRILFANRNKFCTKIPYKTCNNWEQIYKAIKF